MNFIQTQEAWQLIDSYHLDKAKIEQVALADSLSRVLAEDLFAPSDEPAFDKALKDGYACKSQDIHPQVVAVQRAGVDLQKKYAKGECIKIMTGAVVPKEFDLLVPVEDAKESLESAGVFTQLEQKIIGAVDVRAAMSMVESGSIDCGIVYKTDALVGKNIEIAFEVPAEFTPQITYTISCLTPQGEKFCQFLQSDKAKTFYKKFGFTPAF